MQYIELRTGAGHWAQPFSFGGKRIFFCPKSSFPSYKDSLWFCSKTALQFAFGCAPWQPMPLWDVKCSALHVPAQHAAMRDAARCTGHRTALHPASHFSVCPRGGRPIQRSCAMTHTAQLLLHPQGTALGSLIHFFSVITPSMTTSSVNRLPGMTSEPSGRKSFCSKVVCSVLPGP